MKETLAVLRYRHFMYSAIDLDVDGFEPVASIARSLRAEKNRLAAVRARMAVN